MSWIGVYDGGGFISESIGRDGGFHSIIWTAVPRRFGDWPVLSSSLREGLEVGNDSPDAINRLG